MSLRPRNPGTLARTNLARSRMAPGGRRWSESPIPRVATRRVRNAAAIPGFMGDDFGTTDNLSLGVSTVGDVDIDIMYDATTQPNGVVAATGDTVLVYAVGVSTGWSVPAGWTVVASGTHGDLDWIVAHRKLTGSDDTTFTLASMSPGWTEASGDAGTWTMLWWTFEGMVGGTWHAAANTSTGASKGWWVPSASWWTSAAADYWSLNLCSAICVDYADQIPHDPGRLVAEEAWVNGFGRQLNTFASSFIVGSPYSTGTVTEQWASTLGSYYLMLGIGWTP